MKKHPMLGACALVAVLALVSAACGGGRGSDAANDGAGATATTDAGGSETFGDLPTPCGPAEEGTPSPSPGEQGVSADTVTIGYGDDAGFINAPGTGAEMSDAVEAMIGWCNAQGGINGRTVVGNYYDAKITEANNVMIDACTQVFMMVGEGFALDGAAEQTRVGCGLPQVPAYTVNAAVANGPLSFTPSPNPIDIMPAGAAQLIAEQFPEQVKKAAVVYGDFQATKESAQASASPSSALRDRRRCRPANLTSFSQSSKVAGMPTASMAVSTPRLPVISMTVSTALPSALLIVVGGAEFLGHRQPVVVEIDRDDFGRRVELRGEKRGEPDRPDTHDRHDAAWLNLAVEHAALKAGRQDVAEHHQRLFVRSFGNRIKARVGKRRADELGLRPVDLVAENPAAGRRTASTSACGNIRIFRRH